MRIDRRLAIKWIVTAGAGAVLLRGRAFGAADDALPAGNLASGAGYGTDPDVMKTYRIGDYWPLTFTDAQRRAAASLADVIIPADERSPAASAVGITDFVDEWVSAPYPGNAEDRKTILDGLAWLDGESKRRNGSLFADTTDDKRQILCEEISHEAPKHTDAGTASSFFRRFRDLVAAGYYTTPAGMKEIGYVGNVPLATFDGPPADVVAKLGLTDEVKW
jgi:hypothetical protein